MTEFSTSQVSFVCVLGGGWCVGRKEICGVFPFKMDVTDATANCPPKSVILPSVLTEPDSLAGHGCPK